MKGEGWGWGNAGIFWNSVFFHTVGCDNGALYLFSMSWPLSCHWRTRGNAVIFLNFVFSLTVGCDNGALYLF